MNCKNYNGLIIVTYLLDPSEGVLANLADLDCIAELLKANSLRTASSLPGLKLRGLEADYPPSSTS